ncbi:protein SLC31A2 isoform X2 [Paroedura picta]
MVLSVLIIMLLSVLYEAIKVGRAKLLQRTMPALAPSLSQETLEEPEGASVNTGVERLASNSQKLFLWHSTQTLLHVVQVVLGYLVMLAVMSYNVWIFLGVIVGSAIGYYVAFPLLSAR